jgi:hypothetical protein
MSLWEFVLALVVYVQGILFGLQVQAAVPTPQPVIVVVEATAQPVVIEVTPTVDSCPAYQDQLAWLQTNYAASLARDPDGNATKQIASWLKDAEEDVVQWCES